MIKVIINWGAVFKTVLATALFLGVYFGAIALIFYIKCGNWYC